MELAPYLIEEIKRGNVILFLGSGASMGAQTTNGTKMLSAEELKHKLSERFLGGHDKSLSLASVAELSISECDLVTTQMYINELFKNYQPAPFHKKIPKFKWVSIFTTNYDLIVERAYDECRKISQQQLIPIYRTSDRMDALVKPPKDVAYIKLHGSINRITETDPPLIVSPEQYLTHRNEREVLFERLKSLGTSHSILFVGHSLEDPDIRQIMKEVETITSSRPRYFAVMLEFSERQLRFWEGKRIQLLKGSFETFLNKLDSSITDVERLIQTPHRNHVIERAFISNDYVLSDSAKSELENSLVYIHESMSLENCDPKLFYRGYSQGWSAIASNVDVRRRISDEIISEVILSDEEERNKSFEMYHIAGSAGSGKSVLLKRLAWDSSIDYQKICLYWESSEKIPVSVIVEIAEKVGERIFLFIDRASTHVPELLHLSQLFNRMSLPITCIVTERTNEWNIECGALQQILTDRFDNRDLSRVEVESLIILLDKHDCLGVLKHQDFDQRIDSFMQKADRQLLVALHEVTSGKPFKKIIEDEYDHVVPRKAQLIYRTICVMNQFNVPVRAGIINRVHGISFELFKKDFFNPLEKIVTITDYKSTHDIAYLARHPAIAKMVFTYSIKNEDERYEIYISLLHSLDIGYSSDRTVFRELIKFRHLNEVFNSTNKIEEIYNSISNVCGNDDFYFQQFAIFYMRSPQPNYIKAESLLDKAERYGVHNTTIQHSRAELELQRAKSASGLERERLLNKADVLSRNSNSTTSHAYDTRCKIAFQRLEDAIKTNDQELISDAVRTAEDILIHALQIFPDDEILLSEEARFAKIINDNERSVKALEKAFTKNPANGYIAFRLSSHYLSIKREDLAMEILNKVLKVNHSDKIVHGALAKIFSGKGEDYKSDAEYHWQHSFTDGDRNPVNQLWFSRQLFINGKYLEHLEQVKKLKQYRVSPQTRHTVRGVIKSADGAFLIFEGKIIQKEATFALIENPSYQHAHYLHHSNYPENLWDGLKVNDRLKYNLGFTFSGAAAVFIRSNG